MIVSLLDNLDRPNIEYEMLTSKFMVKVPRFAIYSKDEYAGIPIPLGYDINNKLETNIEDEYITVGLNVYELLDLFLDGVNVKIINREDILKIYDIIDRYFTNVKLRSKSINARNKKFKRVNDLKKFAAAIYTLNKHYIDTRGNISVNNDPFKSLSLDGLFITDSNLNSIEINDNVDDIEDVSRYDIEEPEKTNKESNSIDLSDLGSMM